MQNSLYLCLTSINCAHRSRYRGNSPLKLLNFFAQNSKHDLGVKKFDRLRELKPTLVIQLF